MIIAIHQPHFLPWLGYFDKMSKADLFVVLDHVQFERQNYQNRTRIKTSQGPLWLTVPVLRRSHPEPIRDKLLGEPGEDGAHWARKLERTLYFAYGGTPFYRAYAPRVLEVLARPWKRLVELDLALIELLKEALEIRTPLVLSSTLQARGQRTELLTAICREVGATAYLAGMGGSRTYLDKPAFARAGIELLWQTFEHPRYIQRPASEAFIEGLSAVDALFNCGPEAARLIGGPALPASGAW